MSLEVSKPCFNHNFTTRNEGQKPSTSNCVHVGRVESTCTFKLPAAFRLQYIASPILHSIPSYK
ncbi:hypothetical protein CY34DRAFT_228439 [Suillus luteus UH-Slu-Lm8-n1]|uniref:Uncharacterized protein n=1 Tax=Suillus luteus UH-Slu-Lm8-n1 TaxID=930992 RepID=A0A0D0ASV5_9AGAM|nr:hypothetical protein CY34DRAFT_228439 [Suillus luteus UH-Slu-Lm8-n1]